MQTAERQPRRDYYTRAANDDCIKGGPRTRTKYTYDNPMSGTDPTGFDDDSPTTVPWPGPPVDIVANNYYTFSRGNLFWFCQYFPCVSWGGPPGGSAGPASGPASDTPTNPPPKKAEKKNCNLAAQVAGTIQNLAAAITNALYSDVRSAGVGGDEVFSSGSTIYWGGASASINNLGQFTVTIGTSNSLTGVAMGVVAGVGASLGIQSGPSTVGSSSGTVVVAGAATLDAGVLFSGSRDSASASIPAPPGLGHLDGIAGGFGFASASGPTQMRTVIATPAIPQVPTTNCHL
jgi:hypothetical protein